MRPADRELCCVLQLPSLPRNLGLTSRRKREFPFLESRFAQFVKSSQDWKSLPRFSTRGRLCSHPSAHRHITRSTLGKLAPPVSGEASTPLCIGLIVEDLSTNVCAPRGWHTDYRPNV